MSSVAKPFTVFLRKENCYMNELQQFSNRLKACRLEKRNTQTQLAESLGLTLRHYQRIEHCEVVTSAIILIKLADYFNVSIDYLVGRTDNPQIK